MKNKEIPGFENYMIYEDGKIWSKNTNKFMAICTAKQTNYKQVNLYSNGKRKTMGIHVLLALAFISNPSNLPLVDHRDRNRQNNNLSNLRWYGYSDNVKNHNKKKLKEKYLTKYGTEHSSQNEDVKTKLKKTNLKKYGVDNFGKTQSKKIICLDTGIIYESINFASRSLGISKGNLSNVLHGKHERAGGYRFEFVEAENESK